MNETDEMVVMKMMHKIRITACFVLLLCLSGCGNIRETNDLEIVIGIGVDQSKEQDKVSLTAQIVKPGEMRDPSSQMGPGGNLAYWNARSNGQTIFDAMRDMTNQTGNRLFVSHSQVLLFSKEIATGGIDRYIDFFLRTHEMRPTTMIFIADNTAAEVLEKKPDKEKLPAMNLSKLIRASKYTSESQKIDLQDFSSRMMSKTASPVAPLIQSSDTDGIRNYFISGMAVFKQNKMAGTLNKFETKGLLWGINQVEGGVIIVPMPDGSGTVSLDVNKSKTTITPELKDGKVMIHMKIREESSLTEQSSPGNLLTLEAFDTMQQEQAQAIQQYVVQAFEKSKELRCDIFGFGELVHKKYRSQWTQLSENWDEIYSSIEITYDIQTKIRKTELITKPAFSKEEE